MDSKLKQNLNSSNWTAKGLNCNRDMMIMGWKFWKSSILHSDCVYFLPLKSEYHGTNVLSRIKNQCHRIICRRDTDTHCDCCPRRRVTVGKRTVWDLWPSFHFILVPSTECTSYTFLKHTNHKDLTLYDKDLKHNSKLLKMPKTHFKKSAEYFPECLKEQLSAQPEQGSWTRGSIVPGKHFMMSDLVHMAVRGKYGKKVQQHFWTRSVLQDDKMVAKDLPSNNASLQMKTSLLPRIKRTKETSWGKRISCEWNGQKRRVEGRQSDPEGFWCSQPCHGQTPHTVWLKCYSNSTTNEPKFWYICRRSMKHSWTLTR